MAQQPQSAGAIRLTQTVKKGGCAAKLPAGELRKVLEGLSMPQLPALKVGSEKLDDACLWDLGNGQYLVQTLDFFTPIVDDARDFGAIAAANSLSDIYAMGGEPRIALTILAFPASSLPMELLQPLMDGATERIREAGACLAGGHSIDDETLKLGFSVTGFVPTNDAWTNQGVLPGDALILTKGLGTGTITSALKAGEAPEESIRSAVASMKQLNQVRDLLPAGVKIHAATDITGFGLAGHAMQMAEASGVRMVLRTGALPVLPGALKLLREDWLNRAHRTNRDYTQERVKYAEGITSEQLWLTVDPQTSGGLLLALPEGAASQTVEALRARFPLAEIIGHAFAPGDGTAGLEFVS